MDYLISLALDPAAWVALVVLIAMEIVLGIDNLIFISILTDKLPPEERERARYIGVSLALIFRLALLGTIAFIVQLTRPLFEVFGHAFSWRDLILIAGGLFLVWKATREIHHKVDPEEREKQFLAGFATVGFSSALVQIVMLDLVFSVDSIITAVGLTNELPIMVIAVVVAVIVMLLAVNPLANFINSNPTIVMLALGFLLMIGTVLIADGFGAPVPKGYIYAAMAFAVLIEGLNMLDRRAKRRVEAAIRGKRGRRSGGRRAARRG